MNGDIDVESELGKGSTFRFHAKFGRDANRLASPVIDVTPSIAEIESPETNTMHPIDLTLALKATDGDVELLKIVVEAFLDEYPTLMARLEPAIKSTDSSLIRRASHTIKGTLRLFGGNLFSCRNRRVLDRKSRGKMSRMLPEYITVCATNF